MTIYTETDDTGFKFQAALPIAEAPKNPPKGDIAVGQSPAGKALKFVHRGSYDAMDCDLRGDHQLSRREAARAKDVFIEEYVTDPLTTLGGQIGGQRLRAGEMTMQISHASCSPLLFALAIAGVAAGARSSTGW